MSPALSLAYLAQEIEEGRPPQHSFGPPAVVPFLDRALDATRESDLVAILVEPLLELGPMLEQRLVGDLGDGPAVLVSRQRDQPPIGIGKDLEHPPHVGFRLARGDHVVDRRPAAGVPGAFAERRHRQEGAPCDRLLIAAEAVVESFGLLGERAADPAELAHRVRRGDALPEAFPDPGQNEFQRGQGALAAESLLDQQVDRALVDLLAGGLRRLLDRAAQLVLAHHRHDHVLPGDQAGQLRMLVDRPQKIAAQGQDDRHLAARLARGVQQIADERVPLRLILAERIGLLELVDQEHDAGLAQHLRGEEAQAVAVRTLAQDLLELHRLLRRRRIAGHVPGESHGERLEWPAPRG